MYDYKQIKSEVNLLFFFMKKEKEREMVANWVESRDKIVNLMYHFNV